MADSISPEEAAERPSFATIEALATALPSYWSRETSSLWSAANPARGQCGVTSLVVQDMFGGEILRTNTPDGPHFYNCIDGQRLDLTASQFAEALVYDDCPAGRGEAFSDTNASQYAALRRALGLPEHHVAEHGG